MNDILHDQGSLRDITSNKDMLRRASEKFLNSIIDNLTLGVIFEVHRKYKTNKSFRDLDFGGTASINDMDYTPGDIFGQEVLKKLFECSCPKCLRVMNHTRFAKHLDSCMGLGRLSGRRASRRIAINTGETSKTPAGNPTGKEISSDSELHSGDDDDDADWSSSYKKKPRKKTKSKKKKNGGSSNKRKSLGRYLDSSNDEEDDTESSGNSSYAHEETNNHSAVIEFMLNSNSNGSNSSSGRRKDKSKKKAKRDQNSSPISIE